jgi:hypothetical protein
VTTAANGELVYVYAAVEGGLPADALASVPAMPGGSPPHAVAVDDRCSLVLSNVPAHIYSGAAIDERLRDLDWVSNAGAAHHAVVDALAARRVVLPFRLFTLFSSRQIALDTIGRLRGDIERAFERVRGRQEWVLRVARPDPSRSEATAITERDQPTTGTTFLQAKALARRAEADRAARVAHDVVTLFETLQPLADAASSRPVQAGEGVLLDAAFLIAADGVDAFRDALTAAAAGLLRDGCPITFTGPWPPYSFASLDSGADA